MSGLSIDPCNLCPRACGAKRLSGTRGVCGANAEIEVARAALHFWEEPPLSGERGSGAIFFVHCPMHCVFCQNAPIASGEGLGQAVSIDRLADIMRELEGQGALNINCVTPTHYAPLIAQAVDRARAQGMTLPIVWNTSGYETPEAIAALAGTVDVFLDDFKYAGPDLAARYSQAPDYADVALAALDEMVRVAGNPVFDEVDGLPRLVRGVVVRHLILPGGLADSKRVIALLHEHYGDRILLSIMNQYTPMMTGDLLDRFPELGGRVTDAEYEELLDFADSLGIDDYFWQEGPAAQESFVPAWDNTGVNASA